MSNRSKAADPVVAGAACSPGARGSMHPSAGCAVISQTAECRVQHPEMGWHSVASTSALNCCDGNMCVTCKAGPRASTVAAPKRHPVHPPVTPPAPGQGLQQLGGSCMQWCHWNGGEGCARGTRIEDAIKLPLCVRVCAGSAAGGLSLGAPTCRVWHAHEPPGALPVAGIDPTGGRVQGRHHGQNVCLTSWPCLHRGAFAAIPTVSQANSSHTRQRGATGRVAACAAGQQRWDLPLAPAAAAWVRADCIDQLLAQVHVVVGGGAHSIYALEHLLQAEGGV